MIALTEEPEVSRFSVMASAEHCCFCGRPTRT
jgi:hypothetical protein